MACGERSKVASSGAQDTAYETGLCGVSTAIGHEEDVNGGYMWYSRYRRISSAARAKR